MHVEYDFGNKPKAILSRSSYFRLGDLEFDIDPVTDSFLGCSDPDAICTPYTYPPVAGALSSFPQVWQPATILPNDSNALAKWESIRTKVPDISPKVWVRSLLMIRSIY